MAMGEIRKESTGGRICIEVFHSAQLGEEKDTIKQAQFGVIDMNRVSMGPFNNIIPETQGPSLPDIFRSTDHMHKVLDGDMGDDNLAAFTAHDLIGLTCYDAGSRSIYNKEKPIKSMADLAGLTFRVMPSDLFVDMVSALGATATPMPYDEVYSSIRAGVIDGAENNWPSDEILGHYEVAGYDTLDQHMMVPEVLVMPKTSWDKLSADDQAVVMAAAKASTTLNRELWAVREMASEETVSAAGNEIITDIDKTPFLEAMKPVYGKYVTDAALQNLVTRIQSVKYQNRPAPRGAGHTATWGRRACGKTGIIHRPSAWAVPALPRCCISTCHRSSCFSGSTRAFRFWR